MGKESVSPPMSNSEGNEARSQILRHIWKNKASSKQQTFRRIKPMLPGAGMWLEETMTAEIRINKVEVVHRVHKMSKESRTVCVISDLAVWKGKCSVMADKIYVLCAFLRWRCGMFRFLFPRVLRYFCIHLKESISYRSNKGNNSTIELEE